MCVGSLSEREESVPVPSELKYCKHNLWWLTLRFFHSIMEFNFKLWICAALPPAECERQRSVVHFCVKASFMISSTLPVWQSPNVGPDDLSVPSCPLTDLYIRKIGTLSNRTEAFAALKTTFNKNCMINCWNTSVNSFYVYQASYLKLCLCCFLCKRIEWSWELVKDLHTCLA